ncbi:MAG: flavin-dependent oxidoreductase [Streptosporangiales bacterium]|nr:flavin-dependent oxidoreductase [Streptosporangiales bacterium]
MRVLVIGAGIGGLTTALRLRHAGVDCVVYEQAGRIHELGVGINLLPNVVAELAEVGLLDELAAAGIRTRELLYAHRLGQEIMLRPCGLDAEFALPQISIHRGRLQAILLRAVQEQLGPEAVRTGHRLTGFAEETRSGQEGRGVRADFAAPDGTVLGSDNGDVLIGADGIHSAVRAALFPDEGPPKWNGITMWRGAADWPAYGGGDSMLIAGGNTAKLVVYPIGPGNAPETRLTNWALCWRTGRPGDPPPYRADWSRTADADDIARLLRHFSTPHLDHTALVRATEGIFEFPMCDRDPLPAWTRGRVTLLGDAAHPMYPMGSNGAGQAIKDAACLARCLSPGSRTGGDPAAALRAYEAERLPATSDVVIRNRAGGPEQVIDEVERRAPNGFDRLEDVIDPAELAKIVNGYARASGQTARGA